MAVIREEINRKMISKSPLVSICVACYNSERFLKDMFVSVVKQDYTNWEIVIVDDYSTDNSVKTIKELAKEYSISEKVNLYTQNQNRGYGHTLYNAVQYSNGQLVAVLDSDDALYGTEAIKTAVLVHRKYPNVSLTYSNYMECDANLEPFIAYKTRQIKSSESYIDTKIRINHLKVFKRIYYDATEGIDKKLIRTVDKDLVLKLEEVGEFKHIDRVLYLYRKHNNNISLTDHKKGYSYLSDINRSRKQIYEAARKRRKQQSNTWQNPEKCKQLQEKWGDYDTFCDDPNIKNKKQIMNVLARLCGDQKLSVMDVGCGAGHFLWAIRGLVSSMVAVDYSNEMLKLVGGQFKKEKLKPRLVNSTCWNIPEPDNSVDIVYQVDVAMHVGGSWKSINEMLRIAKKYVVFTGPSFEPDLQKPMDKKIGKGKRWSISVPLLTEGLNKLMVNGKIKKYWFEERNPTPVYKHRILVIEK